jgi:murein DD-endopeptidase MepM/ murein hydrolase activator NlpD
VSNQTVLKRTVVSSVLVAFVFIPLFVTAQASFADPLTGITEKSDKQKEQDNSQRLAVLDGAAVPNKNIEKERNSIFSHVVDGEAIEVNIDPLFAVDGMLVIPTTNEISTYKVREGDTIGDIAELFGVSANTIRWANDINTKGSISIGQELTILPVTGIVHIVKKGESLSTIASKYGGDVSEIRRFNGIEDSAKISINDQLVIPNGEFTSRAVSSSSLNKTSSSRAVSVNGSYYTAPLHGIRSRGITNTHDGIDIAVPIGTPVKAMADGVITLTRSVDKGGYGKYVVIKHPNGSQTLYAHFNRVDVNPGQTVSQGQQIGLSGNTGRSTGPHLHYEVRINGGFADPSVK